MEATKKKSQQDTEKKASCYKSTCMENGEEAQRNITGVHNQCCSTGTSHHTVSVYCLSIIFVSAFSNYE